MNKEKIQKTLITCDGKGRAAKTEVLNELFEELKRLELYESENERLTGKLNEILHPDGDGPRNPTMSDLVSYVRGDLKE